MSKYELLIRGDEAEYTEVTPRLRLRKIGSWLIAEKKKQDKIAKQRARQVLAVINLAGKISAEKGISQEEAFSLINAIDSGSDISITSEYIEEVTQLVESSMGQTESDAKTLTMFLASRAEGLIDGEWTRLVDWSDDDTDCLDDGTREKIVAFINDEQSGGSEVKDEEDEEEDQKGAEGNEVSPPTSGKKSRLNVSAPSSTETTGTAATQESPLVE